MLEKGRHHSRDVWGSGPQGVLGMTTGCPGDIPRKTSITAVARASCPWKPLYLQESREESQMPSLSSVSRDGGAHGLPPPSSTGI